MTKAGTKRSVGRPRRARPYLRQLVLIREWAQQRLEAERRAAKEAGERFDTDAALRTLVTPQLGMSLQSLRVLLSSKPNKARVREILASWKDPDYIEVDFPPR